MKPRTRGFMIMGSIQASVRIPKGQRCEYRWLGFTPSSIWGRSHAVIATTRANASDGVLQSSVCRGRPFNSTAMRSRCFCVWADKSVPFGKYCRSRPLLFSLVARCQTDGCVREALGSSSPVCPSHAPRVDCRQAVRAERTASGVPQVALAERECLPRIRSSPQWPGTARSLASAGRSLINTMFLSSPVPKRLPECSRWALPVRRHWVSSLRKAPRACTNSDW